MLILIYCSGFKGCDSNVGVKFKISSIHMLITISFLVKEYVPPAMYLSLEYLETRFSDIFKPYHLLYWLFNDYVYFICSCGLNWIHFLQRNEGLICYTSVKARY